MDRRLLATLLILAAPAVVDAADPTYWKDVRPLLRRHCTVCHNLRNVDEVDLSGGIALDSYQAIFKAKKPVFQVGKSGDSILIKVLLATDPSERMPLGANPVSAETIALLRAWIDSGAQEGTRPDADTLTTTTTPIRVRKRDVTLLTRVTPPPNLFRSAPRAPLQLLLPVGPLAPVTSVAFSPDGNLVAAATYGRVVIWDLGTGRPTKVLTNVLGTVSAVRFSPDGQTLAVAGGQPSARGDLRLFVVADWKLNAVLPGHDDVVSAIAFSPDGKKLASASFDRTVRIWDLTTGKAERVLTGHTDFVYTIAFGPGGTWLASAGKDRSVKLVDSATGKSRFALGEREQDILAVAISPDGASVVVSGYEPALTWWNAQTGEKVRTLGGHTAAVHELGFSGDGKLLVSAGSDGTARLWNGSTGAQLRQLPAGSVVYGVALSEDGKRVATGSFDGFVRLWDANTGRLQATLLTLPPEGSETLWLVLTPEGHTTGSTKLTTAGHWRMGNADLPAEAVWPALTNPDLVGQALRGEEIKPAFTK
jgi:hypothetical protein